MRSIMKRRQVDDKKEYFRFLEKFKRIPTEKKPA
jgi:hypothetical protein